MRFLLDESGEARIKAFLESRGHDARRIGNDSPPSLADDDVPRIDHAEARILVTNGKDFGDLVFRRNLPHPGVILLRASPKKQEPGLRWARATSSFKVRPWPGRSVRWMKPAVMVERASRRRRTEAVADQRGAVHAIA